MNFTRHLYVAPSVIHGNGLFTKVKIPRDSYIGTYRGPRATRNGTYVLWVDTEYGLIARSGRNKLRYLNHSKRPNAEFHGFALFAKRDIKPDQEITFDYDGF